jgi:IS30 family transposase
MKTDTTKNKHLTLEQREEIQSCLACGVSFKAIGSRIGKDPTTISKEVKRHITIVTPNIARYDIEGKHLENAICPKLRKAPFVCNGCKNHRRQCAFTKHLYYAKKAQEEYENLLVEAREGIPLNSAAFYEMDRVVSNAMKNGQHIYHIVNSNNLNVSVPTVYRHLHRGWLSASKFDAPRVLKFKQRRSKPQDYMPKAMKIGRAYTDFSLHIEENGISSWVEMDTVIGRIGGKVIMTFDFTMCNFMFGLLLDNKTAAEASAKIVSLKANFRDENLRFGDVFPLILTDNGGEFADVFSFELDQSGQKETALFFCDPMQSCQKPRVEKNHTLFRDIVPKGQSFDDFTQSTVNLIFSHVNSVKRKALNGKTPFELFAFTFGKAIAELLGIVEIPADRVIQSPKLLNN